MFFKSATEKQLDEKINRIQNNFENNYKDAAQLNLKEFEAMLNDVKASGKLKEKRITPKRSFRNIKIRCRNLHTKTKNALGENFVYFS